MITIVKYDIVRFHVHRCNATHENSTGTKTTQLLDEDRSGDPVKRPIKINADYEKFFLDFARIGDQAALQKDMVCRTHF